MNPYQEFLSCQQDFSYFAKNYLKIKKPTGLEPFVLYPFQEKLLDIYENNKFVLAIKFRQGGFTSVSLLYSLWKCMFNPDLTYGICARTEPEAVHIGKIVDSAIRSFPEWFSPKFSKNTQTEKYFSITGSKMFFGSIESMRGQELTHLIIDEPAFIPNMGEKWQNLWDQSKNISVYGISTTNGVGNWFEETWNRENKFFKYHPDYKEHPDYTLSYINTMRERLGEKAFRQEVLGEFVMESSPFENLNFSDLKNKELINKGLTILNSSKASFEEKAVIYEMMKRLSENN